MGKTGDLFKKIRDTKGTFQAKMYSIKDRNSMDLTEAEDIKKRWQDIQKNCTKRSSWHRQSEWCYHSPRARHPGMWRQVGLIKLVGVMEFQLSYFKSWKMMQWKCCTQYASKFGKFSRGHKTGKGQFAFHPKERQSQRMLKLPHNCIHLTH